MPLKRKVWGAIGPWLVSGLLRIWFGTLRVEILNGDLYRDYFVENQDKKVVAGCWHRNAVFFLWFFRTLHQSKVLMVSRSRDGEFTARMSRYLGYDSVRGSAASGRALRGGVSALKAMINHLSYSPGACFAGTAVDGPQGPPRKFKKGLLLAAKQADAFFIPMACSGTRLITIKKAWDKTIIPLPFSKVVVSFDTPFPMKRDVAPEEVDRIQRAAEQALNDLTDAVDRVCGYQGPG